MSPSWPSLPDLDDPGDEQTSTAPESRAETPSGAISPAIQSPAARTEPIAAAASAADPPTPNSGSPVAGDSGSPMQAATLQGLLHLDTIAAVNDKVEQHAHALDTAWQQTKALSSSMEQLEHLIAQTAAERAAQAEAASAAQQDTHSSHEAELRSLQQQLSELSLEKARVESHRDEVSRQQGQHKGAIAKLEGSVASSERKVKQQSAEIDGLKAQVAELERQLASTKTMLDVTPDRCRSTQRQLQDEALRAKSFARTNEAQVRKLKEIVQLEAHELHELRDFTELERLTLLEREGLLAGELQQERQRRQEQCDALDAALGDVAALDLQLGQCKGELLGAKERCIELEALSMQQADELAALGERCVVMESERNAAAANLRKAERELADVSEYSTKMFRQVRFISHMLDKHASHLSKLPEFTSLSRDLRAFVADNQRHWDASGGSSSSSKQQQQQRSVGGDDAPRASVSHKASYSGASGR